MTKKKSRWDVDANIIVSKETRAKLKMKALVAKKTLKAYLEDIANEKNS